MKKADRILLTSITSIAIAGVMTFGWSSPADANEKNGTDQSKKVSSRVVKTDAGERIVIQEVLIDASVAKVWKAYTTDDGWTAWASPAAKIDLRAGGTIRTHYTPTAKIGDAGTNTLHIINYVPEKVLTLQAELSERWPDVMKQDADNLMNVIVFESLGKKRTRLLSYGVGYRDDPAYDKLMEFFVPANEGLFAKLIDYVENGRRAKFVTH
ncbi:MAG: hypothetical protein DHS20C16_28330 [Phycisphaerae bacterium]|nr:MAG: hypothetical protein DHS20C16_28330 [Phycisphaerae bacterium]